MVDQLRTHLLRSDSRTPSIEALVHAFLPGIYVDHTHADAILALTNREGGEKAVREALGDDVIVLPYVTPGFKLALASWAAAQGPAGSAWGMVWAHHGLVTWGDTARESYEMMISLVSRAEKYLTASRAKPAPGRTKAAAEAKAQPVFRRPPGRGGAHTEGSSLARRTGDPDRPHRRVVLQFRTSPEILASLSMAGAREAFVSPPLTTDHLIRTKALPLWVEKPSYGDPAALREQLRRPSRSTARSTRPISSATPTRCPRASSGSIRCRAWCCSPASASSGQGPICATPP